MVGRGFALFALLGFAFGPGADETLLGVEDCVLGFDWFSCLVLFRGVVGVASGKVVLGFAFVALDKIKFAALFENFILHVFKAIA